MSLVTETNQQYYQGAQVFVVESATGQTDFKTSFNTDLVFGSFDPTITNYALNNFKIYTSATGLPNSFTEYITAYRVANDTISLGTTAAPVSLAQGTYLVVQLKTLSGGNYGNQDAFGQTVEENYGGYEYFQHRSKMSLDRLLWVSGYLIPPNPGPLLHDWRVGPGAGLWK